MEKLNKLFALLAIIVLNNACTEKELSVYDKMASIEAKESKSGIVIDTIFLGFWFGMVDSEYSAHCLKLEKDGKIEKINEKVWAYKMDGLVEKYQCFFNPEYFEGKLYKLHIWAKPSSTPLLCVTDFAKIVQAKYSPQMLVKPKDDLSDCESYYFYKGNLKIDIYCNIDGDANMNYTDIRLAERQEDIEKEEKKKSVKDF